MHLGEQMFGGFPKYQLARLESYLNQAFILSVYDRPSAIWTIM
jgi:hypothetical protein